MKQLEKFLFQSDKVSQLVLKILLVLATPYAYLIFCGIVFDRMLKWYFMTNFIFFSLIALYLVAFVLVAKMIIKYRKHK